MSEAVIHPLAYVDPAAQLDPDVVIGPFCVIGPHVRIGRATKLENHVTISGNVTIGVENHLFPNAVIGTPPQDLSWRGEATRISIGDRNVIRECVTIHSGTGKDRGLTRIGDACYLMACSHVAHDCRVGNHVILTNGVLLGGHVLVEDHVTLSGGVAVHHFARIGRFAFVAGMSAVRHDIPPYMLAEGYPARPRCVNTVALLRNRFSRETIDRLSLAHRLLYRQRLGLERTRETLNETGAITPEVDELLRFVAYQYEGRHGRGNDRRE
ncbi:MAG: acyl-ACP--UDP-N-acetylglucosamine O-acyltransferase [Planctomycetia bacterium]|nr:acyl-ACP--UDP-N-acetylglucosamine O-acyltransferase [Planctomycetia bacterium]